MHYLLGRHKADIEAWKKAIESDKENHRKAGIHFERVWINADNTDEIFFMFRLDDLNKARSFLQQAGALDKDKQQRGEIPELFFLDSRS